MKHILFIALVSISTLLSAGKIEVTATKAKIGKGTNHAFKVMIYEANAKDVAKAWKKKMKSYKPDKVKKSGESVFADNITMSSIFVNPMDIYAEAKEVSGQGVEFIVGVDMGGAYMNEGAHPKEFKDMAAFIKSFAEGEVKIAIAAKLKAAEKLLKKKEEEQKKLESDKSKLENKISGWKNDIKDAESKIQQNTKDQEKQKAAIETQKKAVDAIKKKQAQY